MVFNSKIFPAKKAFLLLCTLSLASVIQSFPMAQENANDNDLEDIAIALANSDTPEAIQSFLMAQDNVNDNDLEDYATTLANSDTPEAIQRFPMVQENANDNDLEDMAIALANSDTPEAIQSFPMAQDNANVNDLEDMAIALTSPDAPEDIKKHLDGDVYVEEEPSEGESVDSDIQHAPLKKLENKRWPNGQVPYVFEEEFDAREKSLIYKGLREIERAVPCVKFTEYRDGDSRVPNTHIRLVKRGCWSLIGRTSSGKPQTLSLSSYCIKENTGTIKHEFIHALGFYHEQARPDRDNYIRIFWNNMQENGPPQFKKTERSYDLGVAYDPISVMHYPKTAWGVNGATVMEWKANPNQVLGGTSLSSKDVLQLNRLYCDDGWVKPKTTEEPRTTKRTTRPRPTTTTTTQQPTRPKTRPTTTKPPTTATDRTTKPTTKVTPKPTKVCGDYEGLRCMIYARRGRCSESYKKMCPRTCGVCTGPKRQQCTNMKNTDSNSYCKRMAAQGHCQTRSYRMRYQMKQNCAKICCEREELYSYQG